MQAVTGLYASDISFVAERLQLHAYVAPAYNTGLASQERRLRCKQYPKRSTTAAEIEAVHQEIEVLQAETDQAVQEYEASDQCCAYTCFVTDQAIKVPPMFQQSLTPVLRN